MCQFLPEYSLSSPKNYFLRQLVLLNSEPWNPTISCTTQSKLIVIYVISICDSFLKIYNKNYVF